MRAYLTVQQGPAQGEVTTATEGSVVRVGRQANADLSIPLDRTMSGLHFAILCDQDRCRLRDLNSTNGTYVNGIRANLVELHDRDIIGAGSSEFQIRFDGKIHTTVVDPRLQSDPEASTSKSIDRVEDESPAVPVDESEKTESIANVTQHEVASYRPRPVEVTPGNESIHIHRLNVTFHDATGQRQVWLLPGQTVIVGRNQMTDVTVVGDASISGVHFSLECTEKKCTLRDLHSQNGSHLNGVNVPYATIYDGDTFVAGKTQFRVSIEGGSDAPDAPLRTWVFEDLVRRKFATFYAQEIGDAYHLVDAVGNVPSPTELLRRLARHRDVGIVLDSSRVAMETWESHCQGEFSHEASRAKVLHVADIEKLVGNVHEVWGQDAMAVLFPQDGVEVSLSEIANSLGIYQQGRPRGSSNLGKAGDWVLWLCDRPDQIAARMPDIDAVLVQHPDPTRWRILCRTNFIAELNRLGYLPSRPSLLDDLEQNKPQP
ncbi:FHA domain-containing protein [Bremerella cremea]|uniref:FHA domain-containing protein n=1 Tax=Bremerella cremea TaxID=1031537 RepID=UPI0031E7F4CD